MLEGLIHRLLYLLKTYEMDHESSKIQSLQKQCSGCGPGFHGLRRKRENNNFHVGNEILKMMFFRVENKEKKSTQNEGNK